jgi:hypothetical protein
MPRIAAWCAIILALEAGPSEAQQPGAGGDRVLPPTPRRVGSERRSESRFGVRGFAEVDRQTFAASDTFEAILDDSWGTFAGGGGQMRWRWLVFEVSASRFKRTAQRAFVSGGDVFRLGIPTTITITPIEFTGAYRFRRLWRVVPYAGIGAGRQQYDETSRFAAAGEDVHDSHTSYHVVAGAEVGVWRWIAAAAELRYRTVPDAIGKGGVSREYGEEDLGGTALRFKILVGR